METHSIKIGIDLGTTNSEIAYREKGETQIIRNSLNDEYTPSVFGIDRAKNRIVGKRAYLRLFESPNPEELRNNVAEVKRIMGTAKTVHFARTDENLKPEEISAEILKALRSDLLRKYPEAVATSAVITVPAHFSTLQAEATERAGQLAGFEHVVLLQEPIAAAMAYGFSNSEDQNWLVYDLGGGTFDVALVSSFDGHLTVLAQNGDNFLGGKDIDKSIVEKVFIPKLEEKHKIEGVRKRSEFQARLKYLAEVAKIELTSQEITNVQLEDLGDDDDGEEIYLSLDLARAEFEELIAPIIDRTIKLAKETLKEAGVKKDLVHKLILVGGPTMIPFVRKRLEDTLGIEVDGTVNPLTVVATGASLYGAGQQVKFKTKKVKKKGALSLDLHYDSLTSDTESTVGGVVHGLKDDDENHYVQIQSDSGSYSSPKIEIPEGKFFESVTLEKNRTNLFWIYLFDSKGKPVDVQPESFSITHGLSIAGTPIPHAIGVAVSSPDAHTGIIEEKFERYFDKGSILPLTKPMTFKTLRRLKQGDKKNILPISVYEGESDRPERNQFICKIELNGENLPFDLPEGTPIDVTLDVSASRAVTVTAYIPTTDLTIEARGTVHDAELDIDSVRKEFEDEKERADKVRDVLSPTEKADLETSEETVREALQDAENDEDAKRKASSGLRELQARLDGLESRKAVDQLEKEFREALKLTDETIHEVGEESDRTNQLEMLETLRKEGEEAIAKKDKEALLRANEQINNLQTQVLSSNPAWWKYMFDELVSGKYIFKDATRADALIQRGNDAITTGDVNELKECVRGLVELLPRDEQQKLQKDLPGITY